MSRRNTDITSQVVALAGAAESIDDLCPLRDVLALVGDKWSAQVLIGLAHGPRRFTELERAIEGISRRMLTLTVRGLERNGLITRTIYAEVPPRVEYAATPLAAELREPLEALAAWAARHRADLVAARQAYDRRTAGEASSATDGVAGTA